MYCLRLVLGSLFVLNWSRTRCEPSRIDQHTKTHFDRSKSLGHNIVSTNRRSKSLNALGIWSSTPHIWFEWKRNLSSFLCFDSICNAREKKSITESDSHVLTLNVHKSLPWIENPNFAINSSWLRCTNWIMSSTSSLSFVVTVNSIIGWEFWLTRDTKVHSSYQLYSHLFDHS